jgi:hypothetical protein
LLLIQEIRNCTIFAADTFKPELLVQGAGLYWKVIIFGGDEEWRSGKMTLDLVLGKLPVPKPELAASTPPKIITLSPI